MKSSASSDEKPRSLTSIILVSYNTGPVLFSAIDAALRQTAAVEVVVVDNGNPEAVVNELTVRAATNPRLKVVHGHGNVGFSRGNNIGVAASKGDYVLVLNPDCLLRADAVERLLRHAASLPSPCMIGARLLNEDGSEQRGCRRELLTPMSAFVEGLHLWALFPGKRLNRHEEPLPASITPMPAISGAFMFLSRHDYDYVGGFDGGYFLHVEDLDLCFRFHKAGGDIYFAPDVVATHIGGTSAEASDVTESHKTRSFIRYFHRHFEGVCPLVLLWCLDAAVGLRYFLRRCLKKRGAL